MKKEDNGEKIRYLLEKIVQISRTVFCDTLTGVYLHGSLAMGCFSEKVSDVDFLIVVRESPDREQKISLMDRLLCLYPEVPAKGMEMSVVLEKYCRNFVYPTPYELHLSNATVSGYRKDPAGYLELYQGQDPDLAAHFVITKVRGIALAGEAITTLFGEVPKENYIDSIFRDISNAAEEVEQSPVYVILNLCRVAAFCEEEKILSKKEGGEWGITHTDSEFCRLLEQTLASYQSGELPDLDQKMALKFCRSMLERITGQMAKRNS